MRNKQIVFNNSHCTSKRISLLPFQEDL